MDADKIVSHMSGKILTNKSLPFMQIVLDSGKIVRFDLNLLER